MIKRRWFNWHHQVLFLLPLMLIIGFVFIYPIIKMFEFSFKRVRGINGPFIGLENYRFVLRNPVFVQAVQNNLFLLIGVPVLIIVALIFSTMLFDEPKGWKFYRFSLFLPYILAVPVVGVVFSYLLMRNGALNDILRGLGLKFFALDWLGEPKYAMKSLLLVIIWKEAGFGIVLFFARLMSVSEEIYDAAKIDGVNWWQKLVYITIPQLVVVMEFFAIISIINFLSWVFAYVYVVTRGGPGNSTQVLELWIYNKVAHGAPNPGMGAAASVLLFAATLILVSILLRVRIRMGEENG